MRDQRSIPATAVLDSVEVEGSIFLLLVSSIFFALETVLHYESFIHEITLKSVAPEALDLVIGSATVSVIYVWLGYSCWKGRTNPDNFIIATFVCGVLVFAYFVVEIVATSFPQFYYSTYLNFGQFVSGYGSVTIFIEMLVIFFTYRAFRILGSLQLKKKRMFIE